MSGNYSRYSHQRNKLYSQVSLVQGAMVTDADQNESQMVSARARRIQGDMALATGVPREGGVLEYDHVAGVPDVFSAKALRPGRVVAQGEWGEVLLQEGQQLTADALDLLGKQADFIAGSNPGGGNFLVFADVWDRHAGPVEDTRQLDSAFLGAETAVRKARVAQLKTLPVDNFSASDKASVEQTLPLFGALRLIDVVRINNAPVEDECDPCAASVTTEAESANHLYRVEVHASSYAQPRLTAGEVFADAGDNTLVLKYSNDNASVEIAAEHAEILTSDAGFAGKVFELATPSSEQQLGLATHGQAARDAELLSKTELEQKTAADLAGKIIRVWDGTETIDLSTIDLTQADFDLVVIAGALQLTFNAPLPSNRIPFILPGDAWVVDLREFADASGSHLYFEAEPVEAEHRYTYLGQVQNQAFVAENRLSDMRSRAFPALTALTAQQIQWDNRNHPAHDTNTVQGALDLLFAREGGDCLCTFCIDTSRPLHEQLEEIRDELIRLNTQTPDANLNSARICLPRGIFKLEQSVDMTRLGFVTLQGSGREATEIHLDDGVTLEVQNCEGLVVADLSMFSPGKTGNPLLRVRMTETVDVSNAMFSAGAAPDDHNQVFPLLQILQKEAPGDTAAWVKDCIFNVLENRVGLVITSNGMQVVRDCQFNGIPPNFGFRFLHLVPEVFDRIRFEALPQGAATGPDSGLFEIPNGAGNALNLSAFPLNEREEVFSFVLGNQRIFNATLNSADNWNSFADNVSGAVVRAHELETLVVPGVGTTPPAATQPAPGVTRPAAPAQPAPARPGTANPALGGIGAARPAPGFAFASRPAAPRTPAAGTVFAGRSGAIAHLARRTSLVDMVIRDRPNIRVTDTAAGLAIDDIRGIRDLLNGFANRTGIASYQRNFGMMIDAGALASTSVTDNHFEWVHSAIIVRGENDQSREPLPPLTANLNVKDNRILRAAIRGVSKARVGNQRFPAAITIEDAGYIKLANNLIQQSFGDPSSMATYVKYLSNVDDVEEGFSAIDLRGAVGPVVHGTGNDAVYFRHTIRVAGDVAYRARGNATHNLRPNAWMFRENTVMPVEGEGKFTALFFNRRLDNLDNEFLFLAWERDDYNLPHIK